YNNYNTKYHISTLNLTGALTKRLTISGEGNLGIGTTSPQGRLQILKSNLFSDNSSTKTSIDNLLILQSPYVGTDPALYNGTGYKWGIQLWGRNDLPTLDASKAAAIYAVSEDGELGYNRAIGLALHTSPFDGVNVERLRISSKGDVGIGTIDTKGYKLAVAGNMIAESVKVQLKSAWPDYVFKDDYKLTSLQETEKHIKENGHLQGIPSAAEVKAEGIDLGEMNKKLLQKIEELTLYLIQKDHQNELLNKRIEKLEQAAQKK
ncbi:hypothetical protein DBR11_22725, partial [Pedobacter sp. HMWF019]|uniref:hypothetical protein n=1 Tax=Pedobacter sp. HMWF019 TaxID=2056856 RepID=UPI000D476ADA